MTDRVLVVDHNDSFVFNLVEEFAKRGALVRTVRCGTTLARFEEHLAEFEPHLVLLSPGPGRPEDAGVTPAFLATDPIVPVLGVCLGHQALAVAAGGTVARAPRPVHGHPAAVDLSDDPVFAGLPERFPAARYHSLVVTEVPACMRVIATCEDQGHQLVMAMRHREKLQIGLQFHPESFLTPLGGVLLERVVALARAFVDRPGVSSPGSPR